MALSSHLPTQAAAEEMDEIVAHENPPAFKNFFPMGRTANTDPNVDLVLWHAKSEPQQINFHIVSGNPLYISYLKDIALTSKVKNEEQESPTIEELMKDAKKKYIPKGLTSKVYANRHANMLQVTEAYGFADISKELFISCPKVADVAIRNMTEFPVDDKEDFSIDHFEGLLKKDLYRGPYVIVQKEGSIEFLRALTAMVGTGKKFTTEWNAIEIPQKSYFQQAQEFLFD